jgi:hypothetical protein
LVVGLGEELHALQPLDGGDVKRLEPCPSLNIRYETRRQGGTLLLTGVLNQVEYSISGPSASRDFFLDVWTAYLPSGAPAGAEG